MTPTEVFSIAGMITMPMWILMILLPKWKVTRFFIDYKVIPLALSAVYAVYIFKAIHIGGAMDFGSLDAVMALFTEQNAVLAGWVHYLAFDLVVGMWMLDQNKKLHIHQVLMAPCLFGTFMFGPIGFLLFMIIRAIKLKKQS
ncbi:ABA4-like family protein [uncultured Dokdonia sp.]|uniref:ABA4-like family protein n=1 Tax=uncultured Dokdonia sp. TaxID=575653 RepID=UPI002605826E|nr:ABA4-like family protein [uncultured Dokdonia sp.]